MYDTSTISKEVTLSYSTICLCPVYLKLWPRIDGLEYFTLSHHSTKPSAPPPPPVITQRSRRRRRRRRTTPIVPSDGSQFLAPHRNGWGCSELPRPVDVMRPLDAARPVDAVRPANAARPVDTARTRGCRETHGYHETHRCCGDWRCRKSSPPSPTLLPQLDGDAPEQDDLGPHNPGPDLNGDPNTSTLNPTSTLTTIFFN